MPQENNKSLLTALLLMTAVYCSFTILPPIFACKHAETTVQTVQAATCVDDGLDQKICQNCNSVVEEIVVPAAGHQFGEYVLTTDPTPTSNGEETRECSVCNFLDKRVYVCPHADNELRLIFEPECDEVGINEATCKLCSLVHYLPINKIPHAETKSVIVQEPTCSKEGIEHLICTRCEAVAEELPIALLECNWGDWVVDEYATPFESGIRHHECQDCGRSVSEEY